jgi:hypothetical protein
MTRSTATVLVLIICVFIGYWLVSWIIGYFTKGSSWDDSDKEDEK